MLFSKKTANGKAGSDTSPSSDADEKNLGSESLHPDGLPPDPDAHLSDEERAKIVYFPFLAKCSRIQRYQNLTRPSGPSPPLETRHPSDPLALPPLPHLLPRPQQHRQCAPRRPRGCPQHHPRPIQCLPHHLLHLLLPLRAANQHSAQAPAAQRLHPCDNGAVGNRHGDDGLVS